MSVFVSNSFDKRSNFERMIYKMVSFKFFGSTETNELSLPLKRVLAIELIVAGGELNGV